LATAILQDTSSDIAHKQQLIEAVLKALTKSFEHDQDDFWQSPSHFSKIMAPLVHQLEVSSPATANAVVIPAVTGLAAAASSTDHHKDLDTAVLKLTRHDDASVRLRAVLAQRALTEKLGDEWLSLLPEMLPFISELQEDDDEVVEKETQRWIKEIEEVLGENLDEMLQ
jgi:U3 small nucleolar RNA-associated protein 10